MSKLTALVAIIALAGSAQARAQSPGPESELVTACNEVASSPKPARRSIRACETLATNGRLTLVDQAAVIAYQRYSEERRLACERQKASPRGASRGESCG